MTLLIFRGQGYKERGKKKSKRLSYSPSVLLREHKEYETILSKPLLRKREYVEWKLKETNRELTPSTRVRSLSTASMVCWPFWRHDKCTGSMMTSIRQTKLALGIEIVTSFYGWGPHLM